MESTDCYTTQEVNDPCEEEQDDTSEEVDDDLCPEWPDGGMVCPVTGCGTKFYVKLTTYWGHWKRKHHEQLRQLYCPKCPHKSLNKKYFATHLTRKHRIKMPNLDQVIASVHTELIPNKEFIPPGSQRCPKRKSVNSESKMGTKRLRIKLPSQDSQCKQDEDNFSMTTAETDVKVSICNVAKDVSSVSEIERLPITPSSEMGQKEKSDKNISYTNETSRNDNISHSQQSKTVTVCLPTEAQNISVSDAESERGISDSRFIMEMEKEKSEAAQIPDNGCHEGGMRCHVPACGSKHFDTLNSYKAHWKRVHSDTFKEFKCPLCSFKQSEKLQLCQHLRLKHKVDKTALQTMLSIVTVEVLPNQQYIDPGTVQCPIGKVHDLSGSEGETKRPQLSAAQVLEIKQASGREKQCTEQTDFSNPAVGDKSGSAHGIWSNNKEHAGDFSFQDKRIFQVGLKVVTEAEISNEGFLSNDIVKQVVAQLEREEIEVKVPVTKIMENAVEIKRKVAGVDIVTVESEKAINTQVLECVTKVLKTAVESKRKVDVDKVTVKSEKAVECVTKVLESPVEIKRKVADVDKQIIESEKAIDTEVLQCVAKVTGIETESFVEIKSKGTIDSEKTVDIQLSESLTNVTESAVEIKRNVADADKGTIVMETAIDTQVSECVTKVTESAVQIMRKIANDDKKGSVERGKAVDTQVCVDISDIKMKRDVDSKMSEKASEAEMKIESKTDSASNCHDIPSDRKETEKSMTEIHESSFIRIKKSEDEENNLPVETETANDKERHGIYISYDTLGGKGDDKSEYDNNEDQIDYNEDKIDYNEDKIDYNEDQIDYNEDKIDYNEDKIDSNKDQSDYNKDQSKYNEDQSDYNEDNIDYHESDQDLTASDNSDLDEAKETEDLETVVRPIFLDGQMLCPGSGCLDQIYDSLKAFYKHWQAEHQLSVQRFECPSCSFKDVRKMEIRRHLKIDHSVRHRGVLEELMSLIKLESTTKTAEDSKPETSYKRKSNSQLKAKIKKQKMSFESDYDEKEDGKDTKDAGPKEENTVRVEIQISGESIKKLSPKKKVAWFFGMSCPVKNCNPRNFVSPREFHNHWENVHHPYLKKFECPICQYKNTQREMVGNHMILSHKAVKSNDVRELSEIKMVDVANPMYKDPGRFYFGDVSSMPTRNPDVKTMATTSPVQVTTLETSEALVDSVKKSPSRNEKLGLKTLSSKSPAGEKEPIKVVFISNMSCPVDKCGTRAFTSLSAFEDHWTKRHLPVREHFKCRICNFGNIAKTSTCMHIRNLHGMNHPEILQNIIKELDTNSQFLDPGPFYFEKCFTELAKAADKASDAKIASGIQKKEEKTGTDGIHELKEAKDTGTQANEESKKISKDPIPVKWVSGMSCPVINCGASYFMTFLSFRSHWENIHNLNVLKFKCPLCTFTNITKANIFAHLSVQHMLSDAMVKAKDNQIKTVKVKSNRYIDPGLYCFSEIEEVKQFQTDVTNTSPSEKKEMDLGADLKENIEKSKKITWMVGMFCPIKACGSETYLTIDSFSNHWIKTHHLELKMFQCSRCAFKAIQTSEIENHLKSHHWILADKDVKAALTKIKAVKVLNPAFKDTEGYHFEPPDTEKEGECSLSNSENKSSVQDSNESESTSENEMQKIVVEWKYNMTCPILKCDSRKYNSWTMYCQHWKMVHEQRYLKTRACPKCSYQNRQTFSLISHMKHCHCLEGVELEKAAEEIRFVDVENPSFIDPGNYTCDWFGKSRESENSSTTSSSEIGKIVVSCRTLPRINEEPKWLYGPKPSPLQIPASTPMTVWIKVSGSANVEASSQMKAIEPAQKEQISPKKFKFSPGMPCPVKNCSPVRITSYSAFVEHWNEQHSLLLKKFACTLCDFKHIKKSIIFMHVRKEHGMPSHAVTKKITAVMENNVKAEELCELEMPTDHSRSIIMVKPDDSGQFDTNGGKIKEASYVVEELKKSDENIGKFDEHKDESEKDEKGQMHADTCAGLRDEKKSLESTQLEVVNRENVLTNNTAQGVYKSSDKDIKLRMSASEKQEKKEASSQKKAREPAEKEQRYPNKLTFVPGMPCPVKNCSPAWISSYSLLEHHWNERHGLMLKKFACTICDFKDIQKSIVFMHVRIEHCLPSHVAAANITTVMVPNSQYVDADELYFPEFPTGDRKLIIKVKPDDSETGVFGEVLPDSSAEQPTLIKKVQMEARPLVSPKDEDMIEKKKHSGKGRVESIKDEVQTVLPSGSSDIPNVADDEDHISDFKEDSLNIDMSEFICIDEIGDEDANEESPEKQSAKETKLLDDQEYEIQDEVSSPTEDHQIEDFLQNFVCIDDIGDEEGSEGC